MYDELVDKATAAARAGARVLRSYFRGSKALGIEAKGEHDFVTRADRESEAAIVEELARHFPDHQVVAEEGGRVTRGSADHRWFVDPLDGTTNFLQGLPVFCISLGCLEGDRPVAGIVLDPIGEQVFTAAAGGGAFLDGERLEASGRDTLHGAFLATGYPWRARKALDPYLDAFREVFLQAKSIRRCGAAALDLAYTAAGVYDGFFEFRLSPWDVAAGVLLVREAGGRVSDLDGDEGFPWGGNVVAAGEALHRLLREAVARHADEATLDRLVPVSGGARELAVTNTGRDGS